MTLPGVGGNTLSLWLERLMLGTGALCLGAAVVGWGEGLAYQAFLDWRLERAFREGAGGAAPSPPSLPRASGASEPAVGAEASPATRLRAAPAEPPAPSSVLGVEPVGRLRAPRLRLSVVIAEGVSPRTLRRAVGHIPGTARPGEDGNVGLAAHRDTFFRRLKDLQLGDRLVVETTSGTSEYQVSEIQVVSPERADLLDDGQRPMLTLVTCYPFSFVGPAPERYVVRAQRVDPSS